MDAHRPVLLIRADASSEVGSGHVMRCWALAQAWQRMGGRAIFACRSIPPSLREPLTAADIEVRAMDSPADAKADARCLRGWAESLAADWVVLDGYSFGIGHQECLAGKPRSWDLLVVDDSQHKQSICADWVLNQNIFADAGSYPGLPETRCLMGTQYTLLREEFAAAIRCRAAAIPKSRWSRSGRRSRILVTMGGADPTNATAAVLRALANVSPTNVEVVVVLGASNRHKDSVVELACVLPFPTRVLSDVDQMAKLMCGCDVAIAAAGSTSYELAACGVPMLLIPTADNQVPVAETFAAAGAAIRLATRTFDDDSLLIAPLRRLLESQDERVRLADRARQLVDGRGAERVAAIMMAQRLQGRMATMADAPRMFAWQEDAAVRAASFTTGPSDYHGHCRWLQRVLEDPNSLVDVVQFHDRAVVGCVRFLVDGVAATVSVLVDPAYRGRRLAPLLLQSGIDRLRETRPEVQRLDAWIKPENMSSQRVFAAAGFRHSATCTMHETPAERWELPVGRFPQTPLAVDRLASMQRNVSSLESIR